MDLSVLHRMYCNSISGLLKIFRKQLKQPSNKTIPVERLEEIKEGVTRRFDKFVCRSLLAEHRTVFRFICAITFQRESNEITDDEWVTFLQLVSTSQENTLSIQNQNNSKPPEWLKSSSWCRLLKLERVGVF